MPPDPRFKTGARPTPRHKLASAKPFFPLRRGGAQAGWVPAKMSTWGNTQYGDCVTAEEAFAKDAWSGNYLLSDQVVIEWAQQNGFLNGADLTDVMSAMAAKGFPYNTFTLGDGPYQSVDYSTESVLQAAIELGPVKIGIDSQALPSTAGNQAGWYATGGSPGQYNSEDHCVSLAGYGTAQWLYQQLNVPLPDALQSTQAGYLLFTWGTLGFVDHAWIMSTCGEAWIRNPTTTGGPQPAPPPPSPPGPPPPPSPPMSGWSGAITYVSGMIQSIEPAAGGRPVLTGQYTVEGMISGTISCPMGPGRR